MSTVVSICIATYKLAVGLSRLLEGLNALKFVDVPEPTVKVIVADNDKAGSGKAICDRARENFHYPLTYLVEPQQGVPTLLTVQSWQCLRRLISSSLLTMRKSRPMIG